MRLATLLAGALLAALSACGGSDGGGSNELEQHEVAKAGFAVSVPSSWKTIDDLDGEAVEEFANENPDFEPFLKMATQTEALQFISFDPKIKDEFATNLNVVVASIPPSMDLEQWVDENLQALSGIPSAEVGKPTSVDLPAGKAVRLVWSYQIASGGKTRRVQADQYFTRKVDKAYVLTFTTLPDGADSYRETFERSARSFEFR